MLCHGNIYLRCYTRQSICYVMVIYTSDVTLAEYMLCHGIIYLRCYTRQSICYVMVLYTSDVTLARVYAMSWYYIPQMLH